MGRNQVEDAYERASSAPLFLDAVRGAHIGRWDVLDALWWESHPTDPAPSGVGAPAARLRDLQRRLFSAGGDAAGDASVAEAAQQLEAEIATERAAIQEAVTRAQLGLQEQPLKDRLEVTRLREPVPSPQLAVEEPPSAPPVAPRQRTLVPLFVVSVALVVGVVVGTQVGEGDVDAAPPTASPTSTVSAAPTVTLKIGPIAPIAVFDAPQATKDIPLRAMPATFHPESFRILAERPPFVEGQHEAIYAARTTSNMICLVMIGAEPGYLSTCTLDAGFPATGLRLYWPGQITYQDEAGETVTSDIERSIVWNPDASLVWS